MSTEFASAKYTVGQLNAMVKKLIQQGGEDGPERFLRDEFYLKRREFVRLIGTFSVGSLKKTFVPEAFFREDNLDVKLTYISQDFKNYIMPLIGRVSKKPVTTITSYDLVAYESDSVIRRHLPKNHVFLPQDLWMIADLLSRQPTGEKGALANDGFSNYFYVQMNDLVVDVTVQWYTDHWKIGVQHLDEYGSHLHHNRIFSRSEK